MVESRTAVARRFAGYARPLGGRYNGGRPRLVSMNRMFSRFIVAASLALLGCSTSTPRDDGQGRGKPDGSWTSKLDAILREAEIPHVDSLIGLVLTDNLCQYFFRVNPSAKVGVLPLMAESSAAALFATSSHGTVYRVNGVQSGEDDFSSLTLSIAPAWICRDDMTVEVVPGSVEIVQLGTEPHWVFNATWSESGWCLQRNLARW